MNKEKTILKELFNNNELYESVYCSIVSTNDYIKELKETIKCYRKDKDYNEELKKSIIEDRKETLKEYQAKRRKLKRAFYLLFDDKAEDYSD